MSFASVLSYRDDDEERASDSSGDVSNIPEHFVDPGHTTEAEQSTPSHLHPKKTSSPGGAATTSSEGCAAVKTKTSPLLSPPGTQSPKKKRRRHDSSEDVAVVFDNNPNNILYMILACNEDKLEKLEKSKLRCIVGQDFGSAGRMSAIMYFLHSFHPTKPIMCEPGLSKCRSTRKVIRDSHVQREASKEGVLLLLAEAISSQPERNETLALAKALHLDWAVHALRVCWSL